MILETELRSGNWVHFSRVEEFADYWDEENKVHSNNFILKWSFKHAMNVEECVLDLKNIHPIPLTENICDQLPKWTKPNNRYQIVINYDFTVDFYQWHKGIRIHIKAIAYLHDLQNTHFILCGEELQIKP